MISHILKGHSFLYEIEKLIRVFFPDEKIINEESERYIITQQNLFDNRAELYCEIHIDSEKKSLSESLVRLVEDEYLWQTERERHLAVLVYKLLCDETGYVPPWGVLTGIRPSKLMSSFSAKYGDEEAKRIFMEDYLASAEKTTLALDVAKAEEKIMQKSGPKSFSLYVSIPFCPSRCSYCSFVSHSNEAAKKLIPEYVQKLVREIEYTSQITAALGLQLENVYFGGGTPTALSAEELKIITDAVERHFSPGDVEYTIEAGRPDSVTRDKLLVIKNAGSRRISVNPQTFNDSVLEQIGRKHTAQQTVDAYKLAREVGFDSINMDLIAGLPGDSVESFEQSVKTAISLNPENITVHTLALKRSSNIVTDEKAYGKAKNALKMLEISSNLLTKSGYMPYYMYRQSKCLGNLENVGWTKPGFACEYNIHMMEETHTVLAVGAGAVSKLKCPNSNYIERIFNFKYPFEYLNDFDEILKRKDRIITFYEERR